MMIILLGPPGAGKGTQAKIICQAKELFDFSTGDILRNEVKKKSNIGKKIESIIKKLHNYELPEIISIKIDQGCEKYLQWIKNENQ